MTPNLEPLRPDLFIVRGLLDSTLCQQVIDVTECTRPQIAGIEVGVTNADIRSSDMLSLDSADPLLQSTNQLLLDKVGVIQKLLLDYYGATFPHCEPCSVLRYRKGQFYRRHIDNWLLSSRLEEAERGVPTRDVSIVGYLNDEFEGGETYFDRQSLTVKPEQGTVLVFPSYFTYPHQALPVTKGQKYAFTTWLFH
ncbi:MAG: prolyl hydroxylase family protein [Synechococcus sp.]